MIKPKIAIIGSGISGLSCAYFLDDKFQIKLYEKENYLGGHSNAIEIDYGNKKILVDTGFIVFNHQTYPNLRAFFELMNVECEESKMSFAVKINSGDLEYSGASLGGVFAQKKNIFSLRFWRMLLDIMHFNKNAKQVLEQQFDSGYSISQFLDELGVGDYFKNFYLLPMAAAIWSTPLHKISDYPAASFVQFFENHGLLQIINQPKWFTVSGSSKQYVKKIIDKIGEKFSLSDAVKKICKTEDGKFLVISEKSEEIFDYVVVAAHSDQALKIIDKPTKNQLEILSKIKYQKNFAVLHKDSSVMPNHKKAWASWVYSSNGINESNNSPNLSVSYWMNNLQNIDDNFPLFVTLNPNQKINPSDIFATIDYEHPLFDGEAIAAQKNIDSIQGEDGIYFCGAYFRYGFHEDGLVSALNVVNRLGCKAPWQ